MIDVSSWANDLLQERMHEVSHRLRRFCKKSKSAKRLHATRKALARLRGAIQDVGDEARAPAAIERAVRALHRCAGKIRDADVLLARLGDYAHNATHGEHDEVDRVARTLRKRRKKARRRLRRLIAETTVFRT